MSKELVFLNTVWTKQNGDLYVSRFGFDSGDGSPLKPFRTIQKAISSASDSSRIIIGAGLYRENLNFFNKSIILESDGIVFLDHAGTCIVNQGKNTQLIGLNICNYDNVLLGEFNIIERCKIKNASFTNVGGLFYHTLIVSSSVILAFQSKLVNCTLIASNIEQTSTAQIDRLVNVHIGESSVVQLISSKLLFFDYCNLSVDSQIKIDSIVYTTIHDINTAHPTILQHGIQVDAHFADVMSGNYTLLADSELIGAGIYGKFIGAFNKAYYVGENILDGSTFTNIAKSPDGYYYLVSKLEDGLLETPIIDFGIPTNISIPHLFAEQYFNAKHLVSFNSESTPAGELTFEMRFANNEEVLKTLPFQKYHWNNYLYNYTNGSGNASAVVTANEIKRISARYFQLKIKFLNIGDKYLLQEDGSFLLQESGDKIILETQPEERFRGFSIEDDSFLFDINIRSDINIAIADARIVNETEGLVMQSVSATSGVCRLRSYINQENVLSVSKLGFGTFTQRYELLDLSLGDYLLDDFYAVKVCNEQKEAVKDAILQIESYENLEQVLTDESGFAYLVLPNNNSFVISLYKAGYQKLIQIGPAMTYPTSGYLIPIPIITLQYELI